MIEFYGYVNGKAVGVNNHKNLFCAFLISLLPAIVLSAFAIVFLPIVLIAIWLLPILFLSLSYLVFLFVRYDDKTFLKGTKTKYVIRIADGAIFVDNKPKTNIKKVVLYTYKKYLLLVINNKFYLVPNQSYTSGSRAQLLLLFKRQIFNRFVISSNL